MRDLYFSYQSLASYDCTSLHLHTMADTFCAKCASWQESFAKAGIEGIASNRFPNWAAVKASADQGCSLCQIIYQSRHHDSDVSDSEDSNPIRVNITKATGRLSMFVSCDRMGMLNVLPVIADESDERRFDDYKARCKDIPNRADPKALDETTHLASN